MSQSLLVLFTLSQNKMQIGIDAANIRTVEKHPQNPLQTIISTYLMTQQGPVVYNVIESVEEAVEKVNRARAGELTSLEKPRSTIVS